MEKVIPNFDNRGCLPKGFYEVTLEEFMNRFVNVINITKRSDLFNKYSLYCIRCIKTNTLIKHYVNGSYVTNKENPGDIDLLVIFDGFMIDESDDEIFEEHCNLTNRGLMKEEFSLDVFGAMEYPEDLDILNTHNKDYIEEVLSWWKTHFIDREKGIKDPIEKGVIKLHKEEINKIREL